MTETSDEEIARNVQNGDEESFGLLVERYEAKLTRYARKFHSNAEDIKDLVQEAFIKAYINIQSFDTGRRFSPWLYRIAHNEFINAMKKRSRSPLSFFDFDLVFPHPFARETADKDAMDRDSKQLVDQCLDRLDLKYREPLALYFLEEMDYQEVAEILRIPVSTVGVRLNRGKVMLKKIYNELYPHG